MLLQILNTLQEFDKGLLFFINRNCSNPFFNAVLIFVREPLFWCPLYLFLLYKGIAYYKNKTWLWLLILILGITITDQLSSNLFKNTFMRLRPCNNPDIKNYIHVLVNHVPISYSFTSSHAANYFTLATFAFFTLKPVFNTWRNLFFLWAAIIGFAQIYVGVHYPLDVLCGALIGIGIGTLMGKISLKFVKPIVALSI